MTQSKVVEAAGDVHHHVTNRVFPVTHFVFHDATPLHATHRVFDPHFLARNSTIGVFLLRCQFTATRLLRWLLDDDVRHGKSLVPHILIEYTAGG